jgi:A/G-specific adenine glycosylase
VKFAKVELTPVVERVKFCMRGSNVLLEQETGSRRTGLWKLPALGVALEHLPVLLTVKYGITRYKVTLHVHSGLKHDEAESGQRWVPLAEVHSLAMGRPYRKALNALLSERPK